MNYLIFQASPWLLIVVLLIVLGIAVELPYHWRRSLSGKLGKNIDAYNAVQAALLTLASFVLGLSFAQASSRFDGRRALVMKEANSIGTTWLRADQLDSAQRNTFRRVLADYTATRLQAYQTPRSSAGAQDLHQHAIDQSDKYQTALWGIASSALRAHPNDLGLSLLMQTLNDTIDVSAEQLQALTSHVPTAVVTLTLILIVLGAASLGIRFALDGARPGILSAIYIVASVVVITMMIDYDRPQTGFVRVSLKPIIIQLQSMK